jgi:hypothetical protein
MISAAAGKPVAELLCRVPYVSDLITEFSPCAECPDVSALVHDAGQTRDLTTYGCDASEVGVAPPLVVVAIPTACSSTV